MTKPQGRGFAGPVRPAWRSAALVGGATVVALMLIFNWESLRDAMAPPTSAPAMRLTSFSDPVFARVPPEYRPQEKHAGCRLVLSPDALDSRIKVDKHLEPTHFNSLLSIEQVFDPALLPHYEALGLGHVPTTEKHLHRKPWEFAQCIRVLEKLGALRPDAIGLALAAGHEPVHYHLSNRVAQMYAGDIYGDGGFAADGTAPTDVLVDPAKFAPKGVTWKAERLRLLWQDARDLSFFGNATVDFVYSLSSIEHFGPPEGKGVGAGAAASVQEQARVLKPGGIAYMTVDTIVTGQDYWPGNGYTPAQLDKAIFEPAAAAGLELVQPVHWGLTRNTLTTAAMLGDLHGEWIQECTRAVPHVLFCQRISQLQEWKLNRSANQDKPYRCVTSLSLAFRKKGLAPAGGAAKEGAP